MTMYHTGEGSYRRESGAVAIFTVIFFLLLVSVITIGFVRIMLQEQSQAIDNDLSQSAYNSAQAGVEDAKRVVQWYNANCPGNTACAAVENSSTCDGIYGNEGLTNAVTGFNVLSGSERGVRVSSDAGFNQAYTCLIIRLNTPNLPGTLTRGKSDIVPLRATGPFNMVKLRWYSTRDSGGSNANVTPAPATPPLPEESGWASGRPPMMRVQWIQHPSGNFALQDVTSKTLFLYPSLNAAVAPTTVFSFDAAGENTPYGPISTSCSTTQRSSIYYCEADLYVDPPRTAYGGINYLRLTSIYGDTDYQLELLNNGSPVNFAGVQPIVDVTGRANDVYRRLQVGIRADVGEYPENVVESAQQICKNFYVTNSEADFNGLTCAPPAP